MQLPELWKKLWVMASYQRRKLLYEDVPNVILNCEERQVAMSVIIVDSVNVGNDLAYF
jgi:hypothetical protein